MPAIKKESQKVKKSPNADLVKSLAKEYESIKNQWTPEEEDLLTELIKNGVNSPTFIDRKGIFPRRSYASLEVKIRKLSKLIPKKG